MVSSPADRAPSADALRDRLAALDLPALVVADGALAVLQLHSAADAARLAVPATRDAVVREARACGFTHVALALPPSTDADVRRAEPAP